MNTPLQTQIFSSFVDDLKVVFLESDLLLYGVRIEIGRFGIKLIATYKFTGLVLKDASVDIKATTDKLRVLFSKLVNYKFETIFYTIDHRYSKNYWTTVFTPK